MKYPKRLAILERMQALLSEPMEIMGNTYSMAGKVSLGKALLGDESEPPFIAVLEAPRPDFAVYAGDENSYSADNLTILMEGRFLNDAMNPSSPAYWFAAAVMERLSWIIAEKKSTQMPEYPEHFLLGNLITKMEVAPPVVRPPEDKSSAWAFFYLVVRFGIAGSIANQYTQVS